MPSGAIDAFHRLAPGDIVFLLGQLQLVPNSVASDEFDGLFEYCGEVTIKPQPNERLYNTSRYVWTEERFPLMFFFKARRIRLPYQTFLTHLGYKSTYQAPAWFLSASDTACRKLPGGDASAYFQYVLTLP